MKYKILNGNKETKKILVEYRCPNCSVLLKNPIKEAGKEDTCPDCMFAFVVPGVEELKDFREREEAKKIREREEAKKIREREEALFKEIESNENEKSFKNKSNEESQVIERLASSDNKVVQNAMKKRDSYSDLHFSKRINAWLSEAMGVLNAILFIAILLIGFLSSLIMFFKGIDESNASLILTGIGSLIFSIISGVLICGGLALLCSIQSDLKWLRHNQN